MALTLIEIMPLAIRSTVAAMGRRYEQVGLVREDLDDNGLRCSVMLADLRTGNYVKGTWTHQEEIRLRTEREKIEFAKSFVENLVYRLDSQLIPAEPLPAHNEEVIDVSWDE